VIRTLWQAASRPEAFFGRLEPLEPRIPRAFLSALLSVLFGLVVASLVFARLTNSTGILPIVLFGILAGGLTWLIIWALGGLVLLRPSRLDIRAWELCAWSWVPAGIMAFSLLPVAFFLPLPSLILGFLGTLGWHFTMLHTGLRVFAPDFVRPSLTFYIIFVLLLPLSLFGWLLYVFSPTI